MTLRDAFSQVQGNLGIYDASLKEEAVYRLLKEATYKFALDTPATIYRMTITMDGSRDYSLAANRIGRIWRVESEVGSEVMAVKGVRLDEFDRYDTDLSSASGTHPNIYGRLPNLIRIYPRPGSGSLRIYYAPVPVMADRGTARQEYLTASAGTTGTVGFPTPITVANGQGLNDYYNNVRIVAESGITSTVQYVSTANEGNAGTTTFTLYPYAGTAWASTYKFRIEDTLEIDDAYAPACIGYASAIVALQQEKVNLAQIHMRTFDDGIALAKRTGFSGGPDVEDRFIDYMEARTNRFYG